MRFSSKISTVMIVKKSVRNWVEVSLFFRKRLGNLWEQQSNICLQFRNGVEIRNVAYPSLAMSLENGCRNILVVDGYSTDMTMQAVRQKGVSVVEQHGGGKTGAIGTQLNKCRALGCPMCSALASILHTIKISGNVTSTVGDEAGRPS